MNDNQSNNVKIAKNSLFLYIRTFISILVTLFTSRIFLNQLGVEDFGIYNLVGGVVAIFSVLTQFMTGATQRFLSAAIGKRDILLMNKLLNISITIHLLISAIVLFVGEILGMILIDHYLKIPEGKEMLTKLVYHISLFTSVIGVMSIPYNALIISKERMSFYALITIVDVLLKLIITASLVLVSQKLVVYSFLYLFISVVTTFSYYVFCRIKLDLPAYKYYKYSENTEYNEMLKYSAWSFVGYLSSVTREQGLSVVLNIFYGIILNAAMGIVNQIYGVTTRLFLNLQAAFRPQIIQNAVNDKGRYNHLINICTYYTILLVGFFCTPMIAGCKTILMLWLGIVPDYAVIFTQLIMIKVLFASITQSVNISIEAYANLKNCMIASVVISIVMIIALYFGLLLGLPPTIALILLIISEIAYLLYRAIFAAKHNLLDLKSMIYYCWKVLLVVVLFFIFSFVVSTKIDDYLESILVMIFIAFVYCIVALFIMKENQRKLLFSKVKSYLK